MAAKYENYWQRLLQEEAARKAAEASQQTAQTGDMGPPDEDGSASRVVPGFTYDFSLLPEPSPTYSPRLRYDLSELGEPRAKPRSEGHPVNQRLPQTPPSSGQYPARTVLAHCDGRVMPGMTGWQNPKQHHGLGSGMGWRNWIQCSDGSGRIGYGHMDSDTTLRDGAPVKRGQSVGRYGAPTNGHSNAPHVHVQQFDAQGRLIRPTVGSPLTRPSRSKAKFGDRTGMHSGRTYGKTGHQGDDWSEK